MLGAAIASVPAAQVSTLAQTTAGATEGLTSPSTGASLTSLGASTTSAAGAQGSPLAQSMSVGGGPGTTSSVEAAPFPRERRSVGSLSLQVSETSEATCLVMGTLGLASVFVLWIVVVT